LSWVGAGGAPSGAAGGSLAGSYPNPTLAASSVTTAEIADGTIGTVDLANSSVSAAKLVDTYLNIDGTGAMTGVLLGNIGTQAAPGYTFSGDIDTGMFRPAIDQIGFSTAGIGRLVIDATGKLGIGTLTPETTALVHMDSTTQGLIMPRMTTAQRDAISSPANGLMIYNLDTETTHFYKDGLTMWVDSGTIIALDSPITIKDTSTGATAMALLIQKSRSIANAPTEIDDEIGALEFQATNTSNAMVPAAYIEAQVDGVPDSTDVPGRLVFSTRNYGDGSPQERMAIKSDGTIHAGAIKGDPAAPIGGSSCAFDGSTCKCNSGYTFVDYDKNNQINADECVEAGVIVDPNKGARVNGFLTIGREINYNSGQTSECNPGFTWFDNDNSGTITIASGECVRYDFDAGDGNATAYSSFNVGDQVEYTHPTACTYDEDTSCKCSSGYYHVDMNQDNQLDAGECRWSIFAASTEHGVSISSKEDTLGPAGTCPAVPGTCDCQNGAFWKDLNTDSIVDTNECFVGGIDVDGQAQFNEGLYMKGGVFYRSSQSSDPNKGLDTEYNRAQDSAGSPANVVNNDVISTFRFKGYSAGNFSEAARITVLADGAPGSNVPGRIQFEASDGSSAPLVAMQIKGNQMVKIEKMMRLTPVSTGDPIACDASTIGMVAFSASDDEICNCRDNAASPAWKKISSPGGANCTF
jgi:hypothetical protein